ncbi:19417_t:CDS:1, partial [Entrophospora sp. SA101]
VSDMEENIARTPVNNNNSFLENLIPISPSTNHEKVLNSLENEFKKSDKIFTRDEMRVF